MKQSITITKKEIFGVNSFKYYQLLSMLYLAFELSSLVLTYKIISFPFFFGSAASLIFPITYTFNDIITEVYGIKSALRTILFIILCDVIFIITLFPIVHIQSPNNLQTVAYYTVLGDLYRSLGAEMIGVIIGAVINSAALSRWKVLTKGKGFWYRSILSSCIGEIVMLLISVPIAMLGVLSIYEIVKLIGYAYLYKVIFAIIVSGPAQFISTQLKKMEGIDIYDYDVSFNPFNKAK